MAGSDFTIKVNVAGGADVEAIKRALASLGATVSTTRTRITDANRADKDFQNTQAKGVIGTANSTKSFSKLAETIGRGGSSGLVGAYATLAANIFAATAAFNALRSASQVEQIFRGLEAAGVRTGRSLTSTAAALKEVSGAAISTEQALRSTAQITSAGFGADTVERLGKAARDTSFALGRNMTDSLDRLTRGVVKLEPELLDELGIMTKLTESNTKYASQLGKTESQLTNFEKRQGFLNAVLTEAEVKFGGLSESAGDSTNFDKLSSSVIDLSNSILNVVNTIAKPIAGILASSSLLILGAVTALASTLRNQLAPGLASSVARSAEAAKAAREHAKAVRENIKVQAEAAKTTEQARIAQLRQVDLLGTKGPKAWRDVNDQVKAGTLNLAENQKAYDKARVSLERSIRANEQIMAKNPLYAPGTAKNAEKQTQVDNARAQLAALKQVQDAEKAAAAGTQTRTAAMIQAQVNARIASREALAANASAATIGAASQLQLSNAWKQLVISTKAYASAAQLSANTGMTAMIKLRTSVYAASIAVKALGIAFLNALPYIGTIIMAVGLVSSAIDKMKSTRTKEMEKAYADLSETTGKTTKFIGELNRVNSLSAPLALRTAQAITIQSNAINDTVDKLNELVQVNNSANKDVSWAERLVEIFNGEGQSSGRAGLFSTLNAVDFASYALEIDRSSKGIEAAKNLLTSPWTSTGVDGDKALAGTIKALDTISQMAPEATDQIIKLNGGMKNLQSLDRDRFVATVTKIANTVQQRFKEAATNVTQLQEAFKSLETGLADFNLSSVLGTRYDQVVKGFNSVTDSIAAFRAVSISTGDVKWEGLLTGLTANLTKYLDAATTTQLEAFKKADAINQELSKKAVVDLTAREREQLAIARERLATGQQLFGSIQSQLSATEALFENAQKTERVYKGQLDLLNAHIQANQALYAAAGAGVKARIAQEERVRGIQANQVKLEMSVQEASLGTARARLQQLDTMGAMSLQQAEQLKREREITAEVMRRNLTSRGITQLENPLAGQTYLATKARRGRGGGMVNTEEERQTAQMLDDYIVFQRESAKEGDRAIELAKERLALQRGIASAEASLTNLQNQLNVLAEQNLTPAQKLAAIREADVQFQNQLYDKLREQRSLLQEVNGDYRDINAIINGTNDSLRYQVTVLQQGAKVQKEAAIAQANAQITTLKAQIDTAKAQAGRANLSSEEKEAGRILVKNLNDQLDLAVQQQQLDISRIDSQTALNIAQKVYFDTMKDGMEWQSTALNMVQKQVDVQKNLADEVRNTYELRLRLEAKRRGEELSPEAEQAIEINTARQALNFAVQESNVRKAVIDLEYALLEAQRQQLADDLKVRREALVSKADPRDATRIAQLNSTIDRLESVNTAAIAESAKSAIDQSVQNARLTLETALTPAANRGGFFSDITSVVTGAKELRRQIEAARTDNVKPISVAPIVAAETQAQRDILSQGVTDPIVSSNNLLIDKINDWIKVVEVATRATTSSVGSDSTLSGSATGRAAQALDFFMKAGFSANQAAGLVGNLQQESSKDLDPNSRNRSSGAYGIAQWLSRDRIDEFAKKFGHSIQQSTFREQLEFIVHELNSTEKAAGNALRNARTLEEATLIVRKRYERPGESEANDSRRLANARQLVTPIIATQAAVPVAANDNQESVITAPSRGTVSKITGELDVIATAIDTTGAKLDLATATARKAPKDFGEAVRAINMLDTFSAKTLENLRSLGPDGEAAAAVFEGLSTISSNALNVFRTFDDYTSNFADKFTAIAGVASSALATVSSALAASAQSKEDAVQREINAEQRRDGKSAESVAKIAALEKKKDELARKQFNTNKKLQMAQAIIATAAGVTQALSLGPIVGPILAGVIGAMGAAQIAIISGTQYQSTSSSAAAGTNAMPTLTIGKRGDSVDLAKQNSNVGGELGYLRGAQGRGTNASNYSVIGSAYGGDLPRGYGNTAYVVGEKGPETIVPTTPMSVVPANDNATSNPINATINIHALDASGVEDILQNQQGNLITMFRKAANANGQPFMEDVNVNTYSRPNSANRL